MAIRLELEKLKPKPKDDATSAIAPAYGKGRCGPTSGVRIADSTNAGTVLGTAALNECDAAMAINDAKQYPSGGDLPATNKKTTSKNILCMFHLDGQNAA
ncbi:hypothetical protein Aduo_002839 [Ancylostoma duodenale]